MNDAIPFKSNFPSFQEGEEIRIRLLNQPTYIQKNGWKQAECQICRDYQELSHNARRIPVYTPDQIPGRGMPAYWMTVHSNSPLYNAEYIILKGAPNE